MSNFQGLSSALEIPYEPVVSQPVPLPIQDVKETRSVISDEDYLRLKTKEAIEASLEVMNNLRDELKIGSTPRMFEAYSAVSKTVVDTLSELRELNKNVASLEIAKTKQNIKIENLNVQNNTVNANSKVALTSSEIFRLLKDAEKNSSTKEIDASFDLSKEKLV